MGEQVQQASPAPAEFAAISERQQRKAIIESAHAAAAAFIATGWEWRGEVPTEGEIALRLSELADKCEMEHSVSTGRLSVYRYIEDGCECFQVTLDLGSCHGLLAEEGGGPLGY